MDEETEEMVTVKRPREEASLAISADMGLSLTKTTMIVKTLLDTGCLVGNCIFQQIVNTLNASHLLQYVDTTICSGFNNHRDNKFQCLKLNISFLNKINF
jgi:hypothetical protein